MTNQDRQDIEHLRMFWIPQAKLEVERTKGVAKAARAKLRERRDRLKALKARVDHG